MSHWDLLRSDHWDLVHKVCYSQEIWLNHSGKKGSRAQAMYNMVQEDYYEDWTIEQINWVKKQYNTLSSVIRNRKENLLKASALSQKYASSLPAASRGCFSSNLEIFPPPEVQSERLFQQPVYYPTWNQSGPLAWQDSNTQVYPDVRNKYQLCQSTYPPALPLDQFVYSSDQSTFGSSDDTWPSAPPPDDECPYSSNQPTFGPSYHHTWPPAAPTEQTSYSSSQPTFGTSYPTYSPDQATFRSNRSTYSSVGDAQPHYFN